MFNESLALLDHLHYLFTKGETMEAAFRQYTFYECYTFKFIHIASSNVINKAITHENDCLPLALVDLGLLQYLR